MTLLDRMNTLFENEWQKERVINSVSRPIDWVYNTEVVRFGLNGSLTPVGQSNDNNIVIDLTDDDITDIESINTDIVTMMGLPDPCFSLIEEQPGGEWIELLRLGIMEVRWYTLGLSPWSTDRVVSAVNTFIRLRDKYGAQETVIQSFCDSALEYLENNRGDVGTRAYTWVAKKIYRSVASDLFAMPLLSNPVVKYATQREKTFYVELVDRDLEFKDGAFQKTFITKEDVVLVDKVLSYHYGYEEGNAVRITDTFKVEPERIYQINADQTLNFMSIVTNILKATNNPLTLPIVYPKEFIAFTQWRDEVSFLTLKGE